MELGRARQTDRREDGLFDQFKDNIDRTRTDLTEAALLCEHAARLELELKHAREAAAAAAAAAAERTQPTEIAPPTVSKYFASTSEATSGTQPPISRKLAKKMRHFFASIIVESDIEQETATTTAGIVSTSSAIVEQPLIEPVVSVAPLASAHTHV